MVAASRIFGDQVGSTAPVFLAFLAVHVLAAAGAAAAVLSTLTVTAVRAAAVALAPHNTRGST